MVKGKIFEIFTTLYIYTFDVLGNAYGRSPNFLALNSAAFTYRDVCPRDVCPRDVCPRDVCPQDVYPRSVYPQDIYLRICLSTKMFVGVTAARCDGFMFSARQRHGQKIGEEFFAGNRTVKEETNFQ